MTLRSSQNFCAAIIIIIALLICVASLTSAIPLNYKYYKDTESCDNDPVYVERFAPSSINIEFSRCFGIEDQRTTGKVRYYKGFCDDTNASAPAIAIEYNASDCIHAVKNTTFPLNRCLSVSTKDSEYFTCAATGVATTSIVLVALLVVSLFMM